MPASPHVNSHDTGVGDADAHVRDTRANGKAIATGTSILEVALGYAARGWNVCPLHHVLDGACSCRKSDCDSPGKHPRTEHGLKDATTDIPTIHRWWLDCPTANVAIATGEASGLWMLGPDGQAGIDDLAELERQHGPLPRTPTVRSGGGGKHLYFRYPVGRKIRNGRNVHGTRIDVRGANGYAVAPPSSHKSGGCYEWEVSPEECSAP